MTDHATNRPGQAPVPEHQGGITSPANLPDFSIGSAEDVVQDGLAAGSTTTPQLGRTVKRGMTWSIGNTAISKILSLLAFSILGILLDKDDYGLYAISFSIAAFVQVFRDGGVVQLLIQRGEVEYTALRGPVFWMALAFNSATACVLIAAAPIAAYFYGQPRLIPLLLIIAISTPLATPGVVLQARLSMQLRFGVLTRVQMVSAFIRYGGTVGLAWAGMGPLSFVVPLPIIAAFESIAAYLLTKDAPWRSPIGRKQWPILFRQSRWLVFVALANAVMNQGGYLVLGAIVDISVVGSFFFAYQLISQVDAVLSGTAGAVLFPALARLAGEPERFRAATLRSARTLMLFAAPATAALVAGIAPLEDIVWHGKWDSAVWPTQALSLFFAARVLFMVPSIGYLARGYFRDNAILVISCGIGLMLASAIGALLSPTSESISVWMGGYLGIGCLSASLIGMSRLGISPGRVFKAIMPAWGAAWIACAAAIAADLAVGPWLVDPATDVCRWAVSLGFSLADREWAPSAAAGILRLVIAAVVMGGMFIVILRVFFRERLCEGIHLLPARFHRVIFRSLRLSSEASPSGAGTITTPPPSATPR